MEKCLYAVIMDEILLIREILVRNIFSLLLLSFIYSATSFAQEKVVVISGGDDPGLNHYSQFLQTKTLYDYLFSVHGATNVSLYFGAGNNEKTKNPLLDVHRIENTIANKNEKNDSMFAGILENNHSATKENITSFFLSPTTQNINTNQNLFIFVSDHGMPNEFMDDKSSNPYGNNCIDLWHYNGKFINNFTDKNDFYQACFSKNELSSLLSSLHPKNIVFEMSQCYSGGFHQLSVGMEEGYPTANTHVCGFTAAPPDHYASGCTADADGATYQGYERSFTEWYTGKSVITGEKLREPASSIFIAHQNATLEDITVDIPLSTSNYYLLQWASTFSNPLFQSRTKNYSAKSIKNIFDHYVQYQERIKDEYFINFKKFSLEMQNKIRGFSIKNKEFIHLNLAAQELKIKTMEAKIQEQGTALDVAWDGMMNTYLQLIMPIWKNAVDKHEVSLLSPKQYQYENEFYQKIITENLYKRPYQLEMYFLQYLSMKNNDQDLINYQKNRYQIMMQWASQNQNQTFINAIKFFQSLDKKQQLLQDKIALAEKDKQLLKRIFTYNKIIAAWVTLSQINDEKALMEIRGLLSCEHQ